MRALEARQRAHRLSRLDGEITVDQVDAYNVINHAGMLGALRELDPFQWAVLTPRERAAEDERHKAMLDIEQGGKGEKHGT